MDKRFEQLFSKDPQMANLYKKRYSPLIIIREIQIKTTTVRMVIVKNTKENLLVRDMEEKESLHT